MSEGSNKGKLIFSYYGERDRNVLNSIVEKYADKKVHIYTSIWDDSMEIKITELKGE